jgi:hypothetical protein
MGWDDFERLSVREWKHALDVWCTELPKEQRDRILSLRSSLIDKRELINLCQEQIPLGEMERLLKAAKTPPASSAQSNEEKASVNPQLDQFSNMSPEQFRYQAACIRKNPGAYRASQPALSGMTDAQILETASQMEMMASNPSAFQAMKEQVKNLPPEQMERLRQAGGGLGGAAGGGFRQEAFEAANMSPEQMRYRAECMRRHPEIVRSSNPMMASLSDDEIRAAADQMEALASSNPSFMKEMSDYLAKMSPTELADFQKSMGGGGQGMPPISPSPSATTRTTASSSPAPGLSASPPDLLNLSEQQIEMLVKTFKSNPEMTRQLLRSQGMTEEQITKQYDFLCGMDESTLKATLQTLFSVQKYLRPLMRYYEMVNQRTGGYGGVILGVMAVIVGAVVVVIVWKMMNHLFYGLLDKAFGYFSTPTATANEGEGGLASSSVSVSASLSSSPRTVTNAEDEFEF